MVENETMHISLSHKTLHFKKPAKTSRGEYTTHDSIIITIRDEKSHRIGLGECAPLLDLSYDRDSYLRMSDVANLIDAALASTCYNDYLRPYPALLFALESALYDYQQNPILYNTPFAKSEVGIPTNGLVWMSDYDEMLAQAKKKILAGHRCIKFKIGAIKWEDEMRLLNKIRSRFTKDTLEIRVDANGGLGLDMDIVRNKLQELSKYNIHSIEQPIPQYHWNENEFNALVSFGFNLGSGCIDQVCAMGTRTKGEIASKMLLYYNAGGKRLEGLARRRQIEHDLFIKPIINTPNITGETTINELVDLVYSGYFGNGETRKNNIYKLIQSFVNRREK